MSPELVCFGCSCVFSSYLDTVKSHGAVRAKFWQPTFLEGNRTGCTLHWFAIGAVFSRPAQMSQRRPVTIDGSASCLKVFCNNGCQDECWPQRSGCCWQTSQMTLPVYSAVHASFTSHKASSSKHANRICCCLLTRRPVKCYCSHGLV